MTDWIAASYGSVVTALVVVAAYALAYPTLIAPRFFKDSNESGALADIDGFLTAKKSQSRWRIAFSFYAGSVGAWAITTPSNYASFAGWVGMTFYALAVGIPVIVLAFFGNMVRDKYPGAGALGDVILARFGPAMRYCTCVVALFNMVIFMLAEFTTIGALFKDFVGDKNFPIIVVMAILTTAYSAYGGLLVSIVTDQIQAGVSLFFLVVLSIYVWATFKQELVPGFGDLKPLLGANEAGYGAILVMPVSLMAATIFNEGMWQRVWAAEDTRALQQGGIIGGVAVVAAIFLYGLFGFIACWGGLVDYANTNVNLYLFQVFKKDASDPPNSAVDSGIEVLTLVLALIMSESAIDSLQNGISATISSTFLRGRPINWARAIVLLINIIVVPFALANYNVLSLFLSANMLGCCWFFPILVGGVWDSPTGRKVISETTVILGALTAMMAVSVYGITDGPRQCAEAAGVGVLFPPYPDVCQCASQSEIDTMMAGVEAMFGNSTGFVVTGDVNCGAAGVQWAWVKHPYMWQHFLIICCVSFSSVMVYGAINTQLPDTMMGISQMLGLPPSAPTVAAAGKEASAPVPMTMTAPWQSGMPPAGVVVGFPPAMPPGMPFMPMAAAMPHPLQQHGMPAPQMMRGLA